MDKIDMPTSPLVVGLILGSMLDTSLHQSLLMSGGSWMIFLQNPISAVLLLISLLSILQATPIFSVIKKKLSKKTIKA
jgi:putative tricarboxylic transport membrane protein